MKQSLKERLERLERKEAAAPLLSGSSVDLVLRPGPDPRNVDTIAAIGVLVRRGVKLLRAKRTIEAVVERGEAIVATPSVADMAGLARDLRRAGLQAARLSDDPVDVRQIRKRLGLTQEQFAQRFRLDLAALRNWEQQRCQPDTATLGYLRVIDRQPELAAAAHEEALA